MYRILAKFLIGLMSIWLIIAVTVEILGITIYFPFHISPDHQIPYHRWQSVRLSVFITFAYFAISYLIWGGAKLYPVKFLDIYVKIYTLTCILIFFRVDALKSEYLFIIFLIIFSILTHIAARPKYRNYFIK